MNRALLVGINKYPNAPLLGCINDVSDLAKFLTFKCNFKMNDVRLLTDERATKKAIIDRLEWLLNGLQKGDRIIFHFSGHGVQLPIRNQKGEVDELYEAICPVDFDWTKEHAILDKDFSNLFSSIPEGIEFIWISDTCHSGDLWREMPNCEHRIKTMIPPADINWRLHTAKGNNILSKGMLKVAQDIHVAFVTGCKPGQLAADSVFGKRPNGVLTYYLLHELKSRRAPKESFLQVICNVQKLILKEGYKQVPQLEGKTTIKANFFFSPELIGKSEVVFNPPIFLQQYS